MLTRSVNFYSNQFNSNQLNFERHKTPQKINNVINFKSNLKPVVDIFEKQIIHHADILVTHSCNMHCKYCVDQFKSTYSDLVSLNMVENYLKLIKTKTVAMDKKNVTEILLIGGEPTMAGSEHLNKIADKVHEYGFGICISTNGKKKDVIKEILPHFDWVQITCRSDKEIEHWRKFKDKVNIKIAGDENFTLDKFRHFVELTKDFPRKSLTMYFNTTNFEEICKDKELQDYLSNLNWEKIGDYSFASVDGVRIKKYKPSEKTFAEEPFVPKLYPNGNYGKTWLNELNDPYLGELQTSK